MSVLHFCQHNVVTHELHSSLQQLCRRVGFPAGIHECLLGQDASLEQPACNCGMAYPQCLKGEYARTAFIPGQTFQSLYSAEEPTVWQLDSLTLPARLQLAAQLLLVKHYR